FWPKGKAFGAMRAAIRTSSAMRRKGPPLKRAASSFGENVSTGGCFLRDEDSDELRLQRPQILEETEQLVVVALVELLEVAEVLLQHLLAGVGVEHGDVDVEDEAGGLDQCLPVVRPP